MKFITVKEASVRWGMDISRIGKLARADKIPGATRLGGHWVIPEDCPRPADGRTKAGKTEEKQAPFRYPSFEHRELSSFYPPLCREERIIKTAEEAFYACRIPEMAEILGDLPETADNRHCRIAALYCACIADIFFCNAERFFKRYGRLRAELSEDFPYKKEMKEFIHELDAMLGEDEYFATVFRVEASYAYHESFLPHLATLCTVSLFSPGGKPSAAEIKNAELNCIFAEKSGAYADLQSIHIYLGNACYAVDNRKDADYHFTRALELAEKYDIFFSLAVQYTYIHKAIAGALSAFPAALREKLENYSGEIHRRYLKFVREIRYHSVYEFMGHDDYIYIQYAVEGLKNKEVSERLHLSLGNVGKHYSEIYTRLEVKNKAELVRLYHSLSDKPADEKTEE